MDKKEKKKSKKKSKKKLKKKISDTERDHNVTNETDNYHLPHLNRKKHSANNNHKLSKHQSFFSYNLKPDRTHFELKLKVNQLINKRPQCLSVNKALPACNCSGWFLSSTDGLFLFFFVLSHKIYLLPLYTLFVLLL